MKPSSQPVGNLWCCDLCLTTFQTLSAGKEHMDRTGHVLRPIMEVRPK